MLLLIAYLLILTYANTGCVSISSFASLVGIPIKTTSSPLGGKICAITAGIKKYKSTTQKKKRNRIK